MNPTCRYDSIERDFNTRRVKDFSPVRGHSLSRKGSGPDERCKPKAFQEVKGGPSARDILLQGQLQSRLAETCLG